MIADNTELKLQEDALRRSEANLSAIIENTSDMVYSLDKEFKFITFNERFKNTIRQVYNFEINQGINSLDLLCNFDHQFGEKWRKIYEKALGGETLQFVNEYPSPNGPVYLSYSINPIWQTGEVIGLSCFSRDITRQKLDEVALIKSEANLRSVFENTGLCIVLYTIDMDIVSFNSNAYHHINQISRKKLISGRSVFDYFPKKRWPFIVQAMEQVKNKQPVNYETVNTKDGVKQWFETKWLGVENHAKEIVGIIVTKKDITEKKNAELEHEQITADLMRRNKDLEQFTYIISHNLRAPVANIKGLCEMLGYAERLDPEVTDTLGALTLSVNQLDNVIIDLNQVLQVGKQINEKKENVFLLKLIGDISLELRPLLLKSGAVLHCDFKGVDDVFTIRSYLYSIFHNLVTNSIKYRTDAGPLINIKARLKGSKLFISYKDNGKGIDLTRYGAHVFGLYKRFDFTVEGKGMGLFMIKMQIESLGGSINIQSELGKGTEFSIVLPLGKIKQGKKELSEN